MDTMTWKQLSLVILASAGAGALISSVINGFVMFAIKKRELERQDEQFAMKLTEMKHQQLLAAQEWAIKTDGKARSIDLWDPLVTAIGYLRGLREFRKTGRWQMGEEAHEEKKADRA